MKIQLSLTDIIFHCEESLNCNLCYREFSAETCCNSPVLFRLHLESHNDSNFYRIKGFSKKIQDFVYKCDYEENDRICQFGFNDKAIFDHHQKQHLQNHECSKCKIKFSAFGY